MSTAGHLHQTYTFHQSFIERNRQPSACLFFWNSSGYVFLQVAVLLLCEVIPAERIASVDIWYDIFNVRAVGGYTFHSFPSPFVREFLGSNAFAYPRGVLYPNLVQGGVGISVVSSLKNSLVFLDVDEGCFSFFQLVRHSTTVILIIICQQKDQKRATSGKPQCQTSTLLWSQVGGCLGEYRHLWVLSFHCRQRFEDTLRLRKSRPIPLPLGSDDGSEQD